ncbi:bacterial alpha-L-rhamnosidase-domain-containing protein [Mycena olivaceomarginata]|nr:bacterial alpha-L-rhamnosidase-domain-containing protein [Mycena olivaceomarginata]
MRALFAIVGVVGVFLGSAYAQVSVSNLLVENKPAPLGIDVSPRFSWTLASTARGVAQSSYRITLSTKSAGATDVWDSGTVSSTKPYLAPYGGPALASDTTYFWSVSVTTSAGGASASSTFSTGFLHGETDWSPSVWIGKNTTVVPAALLTAFTSASWIWAPSPGQTAPNAPAGDVALRLTVTIVATADDRFTLYANGVLVGSAPNTTDVWKTAQIFRNVDLSASSSSVLFAIRATNLPDVGTGGAGPAALLFSAQIIFTDGSSAVVSSSSSTAWKATTSIPANFQLPSTSDASWSAPVVLGTYGVDPWDTQVVVAAPTPTTPSVTTATWIWNTAVPSAPAGTVAFRRTFAPPAGKQAVSAAVVITADDLFTLWVDGAQVGAAPDETDVWMTAQQFTVPLNASTAAGANVVFAVLATNRADVSSGGASPAGLLAAISILYSDGSSSALTTDTAWKANASPATGWQAANFNDASWAAAASEGAYGVSPWGTSVNVQNALGEHPSPLLRGKFAVSKQVTTAHLYYVAGGYASIALNGKPVSDHVLSPGFTKYDARMQYVVVDVKSLVAQGTNALSATLGRSHYGVTQGSVWNWAGAPWHGEPVLRLVLSLTYSDGSKDKIVSSGSWKVAEGPTRLDDIFGGENYDASYEISGWELPGFDDSAWNAALVALAPKGTLVRARQPPTRLIGSLTPVSITQPVPGQFVAAFERVVAGWVRLTVSGPKGSLVTGAVLILSRTIRILMELRCTDLQHYYANNFQTDRFWLAGTGAPEVFEPQFSYKGYQYIQLLGWPSSTPPTPADIIGQIVHDDLQVNGDFRSSSDLLNKLHVASVFTMLNNVHSIPTDCPQFEKNGWSGDAMLATEMFLTNLDSSDLLAKYTQDLHDSLTNGPPAVIAPDSGWGANNQADPWHSAFVLIPAWIYTYRGDTRVLSDNYAGMKQYIEFELGRSPNNIASTGLGDWDTPETSPLGGNPPEDSRVPATAFLCTTCWTRMSSVATVLGNTADASTFASQAAAVKTAFNSAFLNHGTGYYVGVGDSGYRQSHNLLALAFGLTPNATTAQVVADSVAADVTSRGGHLNTGGAQHEAAAADADGARAHGHSVAARTADDISQLGYWIENGATSMWEHWLLTARSHDHMFLGTFEDWFYKYVLGIQATSVAFQTVTIAPAVTGGLTSASGWTMTPFGNLTVSWTNTSGGLSLNVGIPVGVTATVSFAVGAQVQEGGKPVFSE